MLELEKKFFFKVTVSDDNFAFKKSHLWSSYTIQTPFCGVSIFLKKEGSEKEKEKKTDSEYQYFFCRSDFEPVFSQLRHIFNPELSNVSNLEPNFHNSSSFESNFLQGTIFGINFLYHTSDFESKFPQKIRLSRLLVLRKSEFVGKFDFEKFFYWSFHTVKTSKFAFFFAFLKIQKNIWAGKVFQKNDFRKKIEKVILLTQFSLQHIRFQNKKFKRVRNWANFF